MRKRYSLFALFSFLSAGVFAQDLIVASINTPNVACGHTSSEVVSILVLNVGGATALAPYTISYSVNNGAPVTQNITGASNNISSPLGSKSFNFTTTVNMSSPGIYNFKAWVTLAGDANHANDTAYKTVNSDPNTVPGTLLISDTVCSNSNGDTLQLVGNVGEVIGWLTSIDNGANWNAFAPPGTDSSYEYTNLTQTTWFTVVVRSGSCPFDSSAPAKITVEPGTIAGTISGTGAVCKGSSGSLTLTGHSGSIIDWEGSQSLSGPWVSKSNTTTTLNYTNIQTTTDTMYRVRIKLGVCPEDTTPVGILTLSNTSVGGTVSLSVGNDTVCTGTNSTTLTLTGHTGTVVQWQQAIGAGGFTNIAGTAGLTTITVTNITTTMRYRAQVKSGACPQVNSSQFTITVNAATVGGTVNSNATICQGSGGSLTLTGHTGQVKFWEQSINGGGIWTPIANTTTSHTYTGLLVTTMFRVQVKNGYCSQIPSASVTITVNTPSVGGSLSTLDPTTVCAPTNSGTLTYSGGNGTIVDWEQSTDGVTFTSVPGPPVTTANYLWSNLTDTTHFRVMVQNSPCAAEFSDTLTITVLPASVSGSISGTSPICTGSSVNLTLSGHDGTITTWRVSTNGGASFSNVGGSSGQTSISPVVSVNSLFQVIVQKGTCPEDTTTNFAVNADPLSVGGSITSAATVCGADNSGTLTLAGHTGSIIDWEESTNGGTIWNSVAGPPVTIATFNYLNLTQTTMFRARVKSGVCAEVQSGTVTITVIPAAIGGTATISSPADSICAASLTVTISLSGHTGTVIGWEASENGGASYTPIAGASGTPESFIYNFTTNTLFRAMVQNGASCDTMRSSTDLITVGSTSVGGTASGAATVCGGTNNGFVTVSGHTGSVIRWESSTNGGFSWTPLANSDSVAFNYVGLNNTTLFRAVVQDVSCPADVSDSVQITIIPAAVGGTVTYAGPKVCAGSNNFSLNLTGSSGAILRWEKSPNGSTWSSVANTTTTLNDVNIVATTHYRAILQSGACPEVPSTPDTVFVDQASDAGTAAGTTTVCATANSGNVRITGFTGTIIGWQKRIVPAAFATIPASAGQDTITYLNLTSGTHEYKAIVDNGVCANDTSSVVTVTVNATANGGTLAGGTSHCSFVNSTFMQLMGFASTVVTWQQSINGGALFTNIPSTAGRDTVTFANVTVPTIYRVIVSSGVCGNDTSNTQNIDVGQSIGGSLSSSDSVCISGHSALLQLSGENGSILTWQDSVSGGSWVNHSPANAGIDTLRYTNLSQTTSYRVAVQSGTCDTSFSSIATITVSDTVFAGTLSSNGFYCDTTNSDTLNLTSSFGPILNWQSSVNGGTFTDFSPVNTTTSHIYNNLLDSMTQFRVIMNGGVCGSDTSNTVNVQVSASLGGILASGDTVCLGNNNGVINLTNYQGSIISWDSSTVAGVFASMSYTADSLVYNDIDDTITYRVRVQNTGCPADTSNLVTLVAVPGTDAGTLTGGRSFCTTTNTDSVILTGRNGSILLWEFSINGGASWSTLTGQATDTFIYTNLTVSTMYRVIISASGICPNDTSNAVTIFVGPSDAGSISGPSVLCAGDLAVLTLSGFTGGVNLWESSTDGLVFNPIPASDTNVISFPLISTTHFRAIVQSDTCTPDTSATIIVNADQPYTGSLITPTTFLCYGIGSDTVFLSTAADTVFDWEFREDTAAAFSSLSNTTSFQTYNSLIITTHLRAIVKNGVCPLDTVGITLTVDTFTLAGTISADDTVCANDNNGVLVVQGHIANNFTWEDQAGLRLPEPQTTPSMSITISRIRPCSGLSWPVAAVRPTQRIRY